MASRDITKAVPRLQDFTHKLIEEAKKRYNLDVIVTNVSRDIIEQAALFAQGRKPLSEVNKLRKIAGLSPISAAENKYCVTWTMKSKHIIDLTDNSPLNDLSHAVDIAIVKDGRAIWDIKADVNKDGKADYLQIGQLALEIDPLVNGGWRWKKNPDYPHYQV